MSSLSPGARRKVRGNLSWAGRTAFALGSRQCVAQCETGVEWGMNAVEKQFNAILPSFQHDAAHKDV